MAPPQPHGQSLLSYSISTSTSFPPSFITPNGPFVYHYIPPQLEDQPWQFPRSLKRNACRIPVTAVNISTVKQQTLVILKPSGANPAFTDTSRSPRRHFLQTLFHFRSGSPRMDSDVCPRAAAQGSCAVVRGTRGTRQGYRCPRVALGSPCPPLCRVPQPNCALVSPFILHNPVHSTTHGQLYNLRSTTRILQPTISQLPLPARLWVCVGHVGTAQS